MLKKRSDYSERFFASKFQFIALTLEFRIPNSEFRIVVFPSEIISIRALCAHLNLAFGIRHLAFIGTINRNLNEVGD